MAEKNKGSFSSRSFSSKSFTLESIRYVPSAGEKVVANVSGQQPSLNISGEVKEVEFKRSDTIPSQFNFVFNKYAPNSFNSIITSMCVTVLHNQHDNCVNDSRSPQTDKEHISQYPNN
jgi:hypothetical protein